MWQSKVSVDSSEENYGLVIISWFILEGKYFSSLHYML